MAGPWEQYAPIKIDPQTARQPGPWDKFQPSEGGAANATAAPQQHEGLASTLLTDAGQFVPRLMHGLSHDPLGMLRGVVSSVLPQPYDISGRNDALNAMDPQDRNTRITADAVEAAAPFALQGAGRILRAPAEPLAESSLGIRGATKAYGATPGKAILEDTRGIRPSTVEDSARDALGELRQEKTGILQRHPGTLSLKPARGALAGASSKAAAANSEATPQELMPMQRQLTEVRPGFGGATTYAPGANTPITIKAPNSPILGANGAPIPGRPTITRGPSPQPVVAEDQPPLAFDSMRNQFDKDFIRNWNPAANTKGALGAARRTYGAMAGEENKVPGIAPLNQRISSLVPVAERARLTDLNAGTGERILNRVTRPTGGMLPAIFGFNEGGLPGLFGAIGAQETAASPAAKMLAARGLFNAGRGAEGVGRLSRPLPALLPAVNRQRP